MPDLPEVVERFIADTGGYVAELLDAAKTADKFGDSNDKAALAARRMGLAAAEASAKATAANATAADAASRYAREEGSLADATDAATRAILAQEAADISAAAAARASADEIQRQSDAYNQTARDAEKAGVVEELGALRAAGAVKKHNALLADAKRDFPELERAADDAFTEMDSGASKAFSAISNGLKSVGSSIPMIGDAVGSNPVTSLAAIVALVAAIPAVAVAAGGAIELGLGGALAGIGLKATSGSKEAQAAIAEMKSNIVGGVDQISKPFDATWTQIGDAATKAFDEIEPSLKSAFAEVAPDVSKFVNAFAVSFAQLTPAIDGAAKAFGPLMDQLDKALPGIMHNVAVGIEAVSSAVAQNPQEVAGMISSFAGLVRAGGDLINILMKIGPWISPLVGYFDDGDKAVEKLSNGFHDLTNFLGLSTGHLKASGDSARAAQAAYGGLNTSAAAVSTSQKYMGTSSDELITAFNTEKLTATQLKSALDALTGAHQSAYQADIAYHQAVLATSAALKQDGATLADNTTKGLANRAALLALAQATQAKITADKGNHASISTLNSDMAKGRAELIAYAMKMGDSKKDAKALADQLLGVAGATKDSQEQFVANSSAIQALIGREQQHINAMRMDHDSTQAVSSATQTARSNLISLAERMGDNSSQAQALANKVYGVGTAVRSVPTSHNTNVTANTNNAVDDIRNFISWADGQSITISSLVTGIASHLATGGLYTKGYAGGGRHEVSGQVHGPGTGTSDSIPAPWLSDGEFVVNAKDTKANLGALHAMNSGKKIGYSAGGQAPKKGSIAYDEAYDKKEYLAALKAYKSAHKVDEREEGIAAKYDKEYQKYRREYEKTHNKRYERDAATKLKEYRAEEKRLKAEEKKTRADEAKYNKYHSAYEKLLHPPKPPALSAKELGRPEYAAAMAAQGRLQTMQSGAIGAWSSTGFGGGVGTGGSTVDQHITLTINLNGTLGNITPAIAQQIANAARSGLAGRAAVNVSNGAGNPRSLTP